MEETNEVVQIIIARNEYMEVYSPFRTSEKEANEKVKRGILKARGMKDEEIELSIQLKFNLIVEELMVGLMMDHTHQLNLF